MASEFKQTWKTQTELGKSFGLSAIAVGKKLKEWGLKNLDNTATEIALSEGYATNTPLKNGTPYFLWNKDLISAKFLEAGLTQLDSPTFRCKGAATAIIGCEKQLEKGDDKIARMMYDSIINKLKAEDKSLVNQFLQELGSKTQIE